MQSWSPNHLALYSCLWVVVALGYPCKAAVITVDLNGSAEFTAIQPAIDAAADGDTVLVKPGEYVITQPIDFNRLNDPENPGSPAVKNIVVRSESGPAETVIRMSDAAPSRQPVVVFENGETKASALEGFELTGGTSSLVA